ncbi:MAG: TolC family protein [Desulfobacterales bacterium]|nr:TolC family protein [Desulfobacterales bacterium]
MQSPSPAPAVTLTLARAKKIALENSPTIEAAKENVIQAMETINRARADYLPTVGLSSSWDYTEATDTSSPSASENQYTNKISVTQVLFQGFYRKYNALAARYGEKASLAAREDARRILAWSIAQSFLNVQLAAENIRIARSDMDFNREQEKEAIAKERLGTGSYSDVLNYKTRVNSAKASLIEAGQSYKEYSYGLAALMGYREARLPRGMEVQALTASPRWGDPVSEKELASDISAALADRPDLKEDEFAVQEAEAGINREKSGYFPTISLVGGYGGSGIDEFDGLGDSGNMGASVGISLSFEIFSGGATRSAVRKAVSEKRELAQVRKEARITAASEIRSALSKVDSARQALELQRENTSLVETTRDLVQKEYRAGQASLVRMNEAQNDLVAAQGDLADARVSLVLALEELDYYTGRNISQP